MSTPDPDGEAVLAVAKDFAALLANVATSHRPAVVKLFAAVVRGELDLFDELADREVSERTRRPRRFPPDPSDN